MNENQDTKRDLKSDRVEIIMPQSSDDIFDVPDIDFDNLIPKMDVTAMAAEVAQEQPCIIEDGYLLGLYDEILTMCRDDRKEIDQDLSNFRDMILNDGDATPATKEAFVALHSAKSNITDKMRAVADLATRIKLKAKDTFPRYLAAQQNNKVIVEGGNSKREFLKSLSNAAKDKKGQ